MLTKVFKKKNLYYIKKAKSEDSRAESVLNISDSRKKNFK